MLFEGYASLVPMYLIFETVAACSSSRDPKGYIVPLKYARSLLLATLSAVGAQLLFLSLATLPSSSFMDTRRQQLLSSLMNIIPVLPLTLTSVVANTQHRSTTKLLFGHEDMPYIVGALQLSALSAAIAHLGNRFVMPLCRFKLSYNKSFGFVQLLLGGDGLAMEIRLTYWLFVAVVMVWCFSNAVNVRRATERILLMKSKLAVQIMLGSVILGPGATLAILWIGREDKTRCLGSRLRQAQTLEMEKDK